MLMPRESAALMVANIQVPANNAKELVAFMKANPEMINYASAGNGTAPHCAPPAHEP